MKQDVVQGQDHVVLRLHGGRRCGRKLLKLRKAAVLQRATAFHLAVTHVPGAAVHADPETVSLLAGEI